LTKICKGLVELIQKYILQHQSVTIEGWGCLRLEKEQALIDFPNKKIQPPGFTLVFNHMESGNNNSFINWVADDLKVRPDEAAQKVHVFVEQFNKVITSKTITWKGWGSFEKKGLRILFTPSFEPVLNANEVSAERVIRVGAGHQVLVGTDERTSAQMEAILHSPISKKKHLVWILPLLFTLAGIILAVQFAYKFNTQWKKATLHQLLQPKDPPVLYKIH
jgi:nucleoid DNA-binding protein